MNKFVIKGDWRQLIMGFVVTILPPFLINLIPFLWLRMLSYAIFAVAFIWIAIYGTNSEDVVEVNETTCLNNSFNYPCPIKGDYIKERCEEATPVKMEDLERPPKGFKFGDF